MSEWNKGELDSFLCEISANILAYKDTDGSPLLEKIMDKAGQKGTGKWTGISALDMGVPLTLISEAVFARYPIFYCLIETVFIFTITTVLMLKLKIETVSCIKTMMLQI